MQRMGHARHPACEWHEASDPSNKEPFAVAPAQLDPEFGPNAAFLGRAAPGARFGRSSEDREVGDKERKKTSPRQLRQLPLELP